MMIGDAWCDRIMHWSHRACQLFQGVTIWYGRSQNVLCLQVVKGQGEGVAWSCMYGIGARFTIKDVLSQGSSAKPYDYATRLSS